MNVEPRERGRVRESGVVGVEGRNGGQQISGGIPGSQYAHAGSGRRFRSRDRRDLIQGAHLSHQHGPLGRQELGTHRTAREVRRMDIDVVVGRVREHVLNNGDIRLSRGRTELNLFIDGAGAGCVHNYCIRRAVDVGRYYDPTVHSRRRLVDMQPGDRIGGRKPVDNGELDGAGFQHSSRRVKDFMNLDDGRRRRVDVRGWYFVRG